MNSIAITGYGNTKFSREDIPIESLLLDATKSLFDQNPNLNQKGVGLFEKQIKTWEKKNPNYLNNEKLLLEWHTMIHNVMGGADDQHRAKNKDSIKKEIGICVEVKDELIES